jgi:Domain of unknown function (DUF4383)
MDASSPARLYATLVGAVLVVAGIIGFFYEASFATGSEVVSDDVFGILAVNGWHNVVHILLGLIGLAAAGTTYAARTYCLAVGAVYIVLAIWGFLETENGFGVLIDLVPINTEDNFLHLILGIVGIGAGLATPKDEPREPAPA